MVSDVVWVLAAAMYFSSLYFVIIPLLGLASGAIAGRLTPSVSTGLGAVVGLASGALTVTAFLLLGWAYTLVNLAISPDAALEIAFSALPLALVVPAAVVQVIRFRRGRGN